MKPVELAAPIVIFLAVGTLYAKPAEACSMRELERHGLDPDEQKNDFIPPGRVSIVSAEVHHRGKGPDCEGLGYSQTGCDDVGSIEIEITPTSDDRTPSDKMGYRIELVDGEPPVGLIPDYDVRSQGGILWMNWIDEASDDQERLDFTITIRAVDMGGNLGQISEPIEIRHPGSGGCSSAGGIPSEVLVLLLFLAAWRLSNRDLDK